MLLKYMTFILLVSAFLSTGCGSDDVSCDDEDEINRIIDDGSENVNNAVTRYISDPSTANCNSLVKTYEDWIDDLERLQDCADEVGQGAEFRESVNLAKQALADIDC